MTSKTSVVILAAGKGTRFKSETAKVLHRLAGRPLGQYVLDAVRQLRPERIYMVVGHEAEEVKASLTSQDVEVVLQEEQLGTGHALLVARGQLERCPSENLLLLVGDAPLIQAETLQALMDAHRRARTAATVLSTVVENPRGYGRIIRRGNAVRVIVEEKVAAPAQRKIKEINSGILCFDRKKLLAHIGKLSRDNAQREYLLTDMVEILNRQGEKVAVHQVADSRQVLGVNDRLELASLEKMLRRQKAEALMREGVTLIDPDVTYIDAQVEVGRDTVLEPGVSLLGRTRVGVGCTIRAYSTLQDTVVGDRTLVRPCCVITGCEIGPDVILGPFAHLRDGAIIEANVRIGNFVEVKKSRVGEGSKAMHLTYLGDATLGAKVNVGAATVTCNYDGKKKNPTFIEDGVFIGSGSMLVAPIRVGKGSYVAAGSTLTEDVPAGALALGRARQEVKEGWVKARREKRTTRG